jgi:hypothetical protein
MMYGEPMGELSKLIALAGDPEKFQAHMKALSEAQSALDVREAQVSQRETQVREQHERNKDMASKLDEQAAKVKTDQAAVARSLVDATKAKFAAEQELRSAHDAFEEAKAHRSLAADLLTEAGAKMDKATEATKAAEKLTADIKAKAEKIRLIAEA